MRARRACTIRYHRPSRKADAHGRTVFREQGIECRRAYPRPKDDRDWGKTVIVANRLGASGNIGAEYVAKNAPDGYMLLVSSVGIKAE